MKKLLSDKRLIDFFKFVITIAVFYAVLFLLDIGCPIKYITGISCAGCGMTRAYLALMYGDIRSAFYFHPLFFLPPVVLIIMLFKKRIPANVYRLIIFTICLLFVIVFVKRLFNPSDTIVVFSPSDGVILKCLNHFTGGVFYE